MSERETCEHAEVVPCGDGWGRCTSCVDNWLSTYNPATHRVVPKDAVVLENATHTLRLAELVVDRWIRRWTLPTGRPVDIFERGAEKTAEMVAGHLRNAIARSALDGEG